MEKWEEAYTDWLATWEVSTTLTDAFKAGWEAALESLKAEQDPEPLTATLEGVEAYLEREERMAYLALYRARRDLPEESFSLVHKKLEDQWSAIGEARQICTVLLKPDPVPAVRHIFSL